MIDGEVRMVGWSSFPEPNVVCGPFRGLVRLEVEAADRESAQCRAREWDAAHPREPFGRDIPSEFVYAGRRAPA